MAKHFLLPLLLTAATLLTATAASPAITLANSTTPPQPTAYEMLEQHGFPRGILPEGVQGYQLRPDGSFEVDFAGDCNFRIAKKYRLHYSSRIAGSIKNGSISGLEGVKVKVLFAWLGIRQVGADGDELRFSAGAITKSFPKDKFDISPQCN